MIDKNLHLRLLNQQKVILTEQTTLFCQIGHFFRDNAIRSISEADWIKINTDLANSNVNFFFALDSANTFVRTQRIQNRNIQASVLVIIKRLVEQDITNQYKIFMKLLQEDFASTEIDETYHLCVVPTASADALTRQISVYTFYDKIVREITNISNSLQAQLKSLEDTIYQVMLEKEEEEKKV